MYKTIRVSLVLQTVCNAFQGIIAKVVSVLFIYKTVNAANVQIFVPHALVLPFALLATRAIICETALASHAASHAQTVLTVLSVSAAHIISICWTRSVKHVTKIAEIAETPLAAFNAIQDYTHRMLLARFAKKIVPAAKIILYALAVKLDFTSMRQIVSSVQLAGTQ